MIVDYGWAYLPPCKSLLLRSGHCMPETNHQQASQSTGSTCTGCTPGSAPRTSFATCCRYTLVEEDGSTHSVIFINSNAQEFETFPLPGLVYRTIGTESFSRNKTSFLHRIWIQKRICREANKPLCYYRRSFRHACYSWPHTWRCGKTGFRSFGQVLGFGEWSERFF